MNLRGPITVTRIYIDEEYSYHMSILDLSTHHIS